MLCIIVAVAENNCIGSDNSLPWHIPQDLARFRELTMGKTVIMGAKTYLSLKRPLKGREMIVLTSDISRYKPVSGVTFHTNAEEIFMVYKNRRDEAFVIGGAEIYKIALPLCDKLYITEILAAFDGDTFFPEINQAEFETESASDVLTDKGSGVRFRYAVKHRRGTVL